MNIVAPKFLRLVFLLHGLYFVAWGFAFDFLVEPMARLLNTPPPQTPIGWVATDISGGALFVIASLYLFASFQKVLPRYVIGVAIIQTAFNLYHDLAWILNKYILGMVWLDTIVIALLFLVYVYFLFKAERAPAA